MKRLAIALVFALLPGLAWAQSVAVRPQSSAALEPSHIFTGTRLVMITVSWHQSPAAARWLMVFDGSTVPANGAVRPVYCQYMSGSSTQTDGSIQYDFSSHPIWMNTGTVAAVSINAGGCLSLTLDGNYDTFYAQVTN